MKYRMTQPQTDASFGSSNVPVVNSTPPPRKSYNLFSFNSLIFLFFVVLMVACDPVISPPTANAGPDQMDIVEGGSVTLGGSGIPGSVTLNGFETPGSVSFGWEQIIAEGERIVRIHNAESANATFNAPLVPAGTTRTLEFELTVTSVGGSSTDRVRITVSPSNDKVDADGDGLIEIDSLEMLNNMRYNLAGTSYDTDASDSTDNPGSGDGDTGLTSGCPGSACTGYELIQDLNFDLDEDGMTWSGDSASGFTLDTDDNNATYFPIPAADSTDAGWLPIGDSSNRFTGIFDGNGHTISNMAIRRGLIYVGLFARVSGADSVIRNIGLVNSLADSTGTPFNSVIGTLVGEVAAGSVIASYSRNGTVDGGPTTHLTPAIGILTGIVGNGTIIASYATGTVTGGDTNSDDTGVLLGQLGNLSGHAVVIASYANGTANSGAGNAANVGVLVGHITGSSGTFIGSSYAHGVADGGAGDDDNVGVLFGRRSSNDPVVSKSYGFGDTDGVDDDDMPNSEGTTYPSGVTAASGLTADNAGASWNDAASNTLGAWDFGNAMQDPILRYADYDGPNGDVYSCDIFPEGLCGTIIPGQGR